MATGDVTSESVRLDARKAAKFDGVDDDINIPASPFNFPTATPEKFTMHADVKLTDAQSAGQSSGIFCIRTGSLRGYGIQHQNVAGVSRAEGYLRSDGGQSVTSDDSGVLTLNEWTSVTLVHNGTHIKLYVDGTFIENAATRDLNSGTMADAKIGDSDVLGGTGQHFGGLIRNLRYYKRALDTTEITQLANGENVTEGLQNYYKLDVDATDSVGSNDGTVTGAEFVDDETNLATAMRNLRVSGNDKYLLEGLEGGRVLITHIEE